MDQDATTAGMLTEVRHARLPYSYSVRSCLVVEISTVVAAGRLWKTLAQLPSATADGNVRERAGIPRIRIRLPDSRCYFGSFERSSVRASVAGCALFPERILRCRLVIRLYYKAFAETRSCLPLSIRSRRKKNVYTQRRKRRDATPTRLDRFGLGRSKTLLEHAHSRRSRETRTPRQYSEAVEVWAAELAQHFGGRPVAVALEQARGAVIGMLSQVCPSHLIPRALHDAGQLPQELFPFRRQE
jgi:hypothetical protein